MSNQYIGTSSGIEIVGGVLAIFYYVFILIEAIWGYSLLSSDCKNSDLRLSLRALLTLGVVGLTSFISYLMCHFSCNRKVNTVDAVGRVPTWLIMFVFVSSITTIAFQGTIQKALDSGDETEKPCRSSDYFRYMNIASIVFSCFIIVVLILVLFSRLRSNLGRGDVEKQQELVKAQKIRQQQKQQETKQLAERASELEQQHRADQEYSRAQERLKKAKELVQPPPVVQTRPVGLTPYQPPAFQPQRQPLPPPLPLQRSQSEQFQKPPLYPLQPKRSQSNQIPVGKSLRRIPATGLSLNNRTAPRKSIQSSNHRIPPPIPPLNNRTASRKSIQSSNHRIPPLIPRSPIQSSNHRIPPPIPPLTNRTAPRKSIQSNNHRIPPPIPQPPIQSTINLRGPPPPIPLRPTQIENNRPVPPIPNQKGPSVRAFNLPSRPNRNVIRPTVRKNTQDEAKLFEVPSTPISDEVPSTPISDEEHFARLKGPNPFGSDNSAFSTGKSSYYSSFSSPPFVGMSSEGQPTQ